MLTILTVLTLGVAAILVGAQPKHVPVPARR